MNQNAEIIHAENPLLLVINPSLVFLGILKAVLRRTGCEVDIVSFQQMERATLWLSGKMDREKAAKYPYPTSWDHYPALRNPVIAIVSLGFPINEREYVMDWLYVKSRSTKIITTAAAEEKSDLDDFRDELYWRHVVSHLPQPVIVEDVIERVVAVLHA